MAEIPNVAAGTACAKGERITPEIPLEGDDGAGEHAGPDQREGRFPARETRVEEAETRYHDQHHGRGHDDVGLITRLEPLVQVLDIWSSQHISLGFQSAEGGFAGRVAQW